MFDKAKEMCMLGKYFGTDGVRGLANVELTPELAFKLGRVSGFLFANESKTPKVLIGRDTRVSGHMFEGALIAGLLSVGAEVMRLGVISTPGVAYLTRATSAEMGIMISASHNSFEDNGIKLFGPDGYKLTDNQEAEIEDLLDEDDQLPRPVGEKIGTVNDYFEGSQKYLSYLKETIDNDFAGISIVLDCANGATSSLAPHLFADLEAEDIHTVGTNPDGMNINDGVGSTSPQKLRELVLEKNAHIGLAFDGDGDRLIVVDEMGNLINGDQIMFVCARYLKEVGHLNNDTVVSTVMSNIGFHRSLNQYDIKSVQTAVGDRYVMEEMRKGNYSFGGEQSGHIIFLEYGTTGDGMLSGIQLINIMKETGKKLSELVGEMKVFPQVLKNIEVDNKEEILEHPQIISEINRIEDELGDGGRILVRPSGTEPLIRVMVEAEAEEQCEKYVDQLIDSIKNLL